MSRATLCKVRLMRPWPFSMSVLLVLVAHIFAQPGQQKVAALKLSDDEKQLLELTNAERKKEKLPLLMAHPLLFHAARAHAHNMAKQEKLEHELDGKSPFDRLDDAKYDFKSGGENIGMSAGDTPVADVFKLWMESEKHRANVLSAKYTEIGLGLAKNGKGETYCTQVFATPMK